MTELERGARLPISDEETGLPLKCSLCDYEPPTVADAVGHAFDHISQADAARAEAAKA